MGTILASAIITQIHELAGDPDAITWTDPQALVWINEGQRAIATFRPDASTETLSVKLIPGTLQTITGRRLMSVHHNQGADGSTPGNAIRLVERGVLDELDPGWHAAAAATIIDEYIYDSREPKTFWVNPPVSTTTNVYIKLTQAIDPADIASTGTAITLDDIYQPALLEWALYRVFGRDAEETPNYGRSLSYLKNFYQLLGIKTPTDSALSPKRREHLQSKAS